MTAFIVVGFFEDKSQKSEKTEYQKMNKGSRAFIWRNDN